MEPKTNRPETNDPELATPTQTPPTRRRFIVSVFGDITRTGPWPAQRRLSPVAVFGDIDLDLRHFRIEVDDRNANRRRAHVDRGDARRRH